MYSLVSGSLFFFFLPISIFKKASLLSEAKMILFHCLGFLLVCVNHNLWIHPSTHGHLGSLHCGFIGNNHTQWVPRSSKGAHKWPDQRVQWLMLAAFPCVPALHVPLDVLLKERKPEDPWHPPSIWFYTVCLGIFTPWILCIGLPFWVCWM